jgi:hypothetical protein
MQNADDNHDAVALQRFTSRHWAQVPLKFGSCATLVLLHAVVLGRLCGAALGSGRRRMALEQDIGGGAVQYWGQVLVTGAAAR